MCGEKQRRPEGRRGHHGSPPRVRGKGENRRAKNLKFRITPACAGKSKSGTTWTCSATDHPRVCGEKSTRRIFLKESFGSPPRVRGKVDVTVGTPERLRITPACAGKTPSLPLPEWEAGDHPRVCGENQIESLGEIDSRGSPPRVRGKLSRRWRHALGRRITPACAGKTDLDL